jgi:hypothetical protein
MRSLHSFTLTPRAAEIVQAWKKGTKSGRVSTCIVKYGNDYTLNPSGVRYWQETVNFLNEEIAKRNRKIDALVTRQGVKHHLAELFKAILGR